MTFCIVLYFIIGLAIVVEFIVEEGWPPLVEIIVTILLWLPILLFALYEIYVLGKKP